MAVPRTLLAAALIGSAAAVLTACTPADSRPTVAAASAAASADDLGEDVLDDDFDLMDEEQLDEPAEPEAPAPAPAASCTAPVRHPGHQVLVVVTADTAELTAQPARYACDEERYEPAGAPVHYGFAAAGVAATLLDRTPGAPPRPVRLAELVDHLDTCLADLVPAAPYACRGEAYDVVLDSHGRIMQIAELDQP
ncbi:hypothetical protein [Streptomyces rubellomurinus]|uniref:Lipoprotein n=2 Tax=Streptomyces TaxID=1883 RepID=A0A0F2TIN7_STRR3|nr:hypothetical protein [Streptomyces rubellomurinus]KJS55826.1 hypothetical protein VM98_10745 [Streptomyces rubellomurinus subsp. indigoferus]KJS63108.1 hypothetical protein VM95_05220 [Streptomyces rubellomurinus]